MCSVLLPFGYGNYRLAFRVHRGKSLNVSFLFIVARHRLLKFSGVALSSFHREGVFKLRVLFSPHVIGGHFYSPF